VFQVSFGSTSPALSDRQEFPLFYRTVAPDSSHNPARLAFVRGFGWDTVTALSQNEDVYSLVSVTNEELYALYSSPISIRMIKSRTVRWVGHVARMGEREMYTGF
jgi:hypothetical protein